MLAEQNYFEALGVPRDATADEIRRAYRRLVRELHPDTNPDSKENPDRFILVQEAFEVLSNPLKRKKYESGLPPEKFKIEVNAIYSRSALIKIKEPQLIFALLEIAPPQDADSVPAPPINVSLLLDHSTSMKGSRMDIVKTAAIEIIREIRPEDILSIISFGDHANVILPAGARRDMREVEHTIQMLQAGGGTEIFSGLDAGFKEVHRNASARFINHILLLTDGRTYGDEEKCLALANEAAQMGIGISGLGIGTEWNDKFLDQLAAITGGDTTYIENSGDIKRYLDDKFRRLSNIYADNLRFAFTKDDGVKINYAFRIQPEAAPLTIENDELRLGAIHIQQPSKVLFEMMVSSVPEDADEVTLAEGRMTMEIPSSAEPKLTRRIVLARPVQISAISEQTPPEIISALSQVTLYRMHEKAQHDVEKGNIEEAVQRLQNLATHLLAQGENDLARTVLIEAQNVRRTRMLSEGGNKKIKYGTRSLLLPSGPQGINLP
jgi:Ca-activated chloride channel family protein